MESNNKRIAKNTLMLYFRMMLMMGVSLYTVRVVLDTLGAVDYGLYNVVGGIVAMFGFLSGTMASASQRFFSFELGRKNHDQLKKTFSMTMTIYVMLGVIILVLAETLGLWFLNNKMTIPPERMEAARWVYQFSILSFMMTMFTIPYNASIIARERMNVYAWVSIVEVILKLAIVYVLVVFSFDKLKLYAILMFGVTTLVTFIYRTYCKWKFEECRFAFYWDKGLFREIVSYSGWSLFGALVGIFRNQGVGILINIFFSPIVNTAQAIAYRVNEALVSFSNNFYTAVRPQIIKSFSIGEKMELEKLIIRSSKSAFFLMMILTLPVLIETNFLFSLWLKDYPPYTVIMSRIIIANALIEGINSPIITTIQASGKIKTYQTIIAILQLLIFPISYFLYRHGYQPYVPYLVMIFLTITSFMPRLFIYQKVSGLRALPFLKNVIPSISVVFCAVMCPLLFLHFYISTDMLRFTLILITDVFLSIITIYLIGLNSNERKYIKKMISKNLKK